MKTKVAIIGFICVCSLLNAQDSNQINNMINESLLLYLERQPETSSEVICLDNYPVNFSFSEEILEKDVKFMSLHTPLGHRASKEIKNTNSFSPKNLARLWLGQRCKMPQLVLLFKISQQVALFEIDSVFYVSFEDSVFHKPTLVRVNDNRYTHKWVHGEYLDGEVCVCISGGVTTPSEMEALDEWR